MATRQLTAGVGLKAAHLADAFACQAPGLWLEVHPENWMVQGGPRRAWLHRLRQQHALSLHGVSLSLAGSRPPQPQALQRLDHLVREVEPVLVSEHLAWCRAEPGCWPDLLPFALTSEALRRIARHVGQVQDTLGRRIAIENPAHYVRLDGHEWSETDFLAELARRSGCGLLLDLNNVWVGANNLGYDAQAYVDAFPAEAVMELHLAGHREDPRHGAALLIDSHDAPVAAGVWALWQRCVARMGPRPTLIERDGNIPPWCELLAERERAHRHLTPAAQRA